jgi:hypothetical protein
MKFNHRLSGRYKLEIVGKEGIRNIHVFDNMVVDNGLEQIGNNNVLLTDCQVGVGNNPALPTDTSLEVLNSHTSLVTEAISFSHSQIKPYVLETNVSFSFPFGYITQPIREISVGNTVNADIFSRALIRDFNGNPTVLTVRPDEGLNVTYTIETHANPAGSTVNMVINGVNTVVTIRPSMLNVGSAWTPLKTGLDTDLGNFATAFDTPMVDNLESAVYNIINSADKFRSDPYIPLSNKRTHYLKFNRDRGNFANGIKTIFIASNTRFLGAYQLEFNPPIMKTDQTSLSLVIETSWMRKGTV